MKKILLLTLFAFYGTVSIIAQNILTDDVNVQVKNEEAVNSDALEYSPAFYENGIVFISDNKVEDDGLLDFRINKNTMSIFLSRRNEEGELGEPMPFAKEITTKFHEGPLTFNKTNSQIFFSRNDHLNGKTVPASDGIIKQVIISADYSGGQWVNLQELPFCDKEYDYVHPAINVDDNVLYFSSDRPGGQGGFDIWKVTKSGEFWGEPVNLGPDVNTAANEVFPYVHADGMLFFSSNGHNSMGGGDIFFTREYNGAYVAPVNLGSRFNTANDDFGFIIDRDKRNGYFSSNREGGNGQDDIYSFFIDEELGKDIFQFPDDHPATIASNGAINNPGGGALANNGFGENKILLFVADKVNGREIEDAEIQYVDLEQLTNTEIITDPNGNIIQLISSEDGEAVTLSTEPGSAKGMTDQDGSCILYIGNGNYLVNITKTGYKPQQLLIAATDMQQEMMVLLEPATDCANYNGTVVNAAGNPVSGATIILKDEDELAVKNLTSDVSGNFTFCLECGRTYSVNAEKGGDRIREVITISPDCNGGKTQQLILQLPGSGGADGSGLVTGTTIRLERIYYNFNDASIRPDAREELNTLADLLKTYPSLQIEIASHTDSRGTNRYNDELSQRRADKVVAYLVNRGIDDSRLYPQGYGETELLNQCSDGVSCSELDHQYNRRTEVRIRAGLEGIAYEYVSNPPETIDPAPPSVTNGGAYRRGDTGGSSGTYQVVAGSFSNRSNAENRLFRVQQLGYSTAKIIQGPGIAHNVVLVETFADYGSARKLADEIENIHNVNTYVRRL